MLLFGMSPLSVQSMRMVMLDTIGLPWILGAFALALSPRKRLWAFAACGLCFAAGVLSKETYLTLLPVLIYQVWQRAEGPTRRMCLCMFSVCSVGILTFYPIYASLKGELIPGTAHVSLISSAEWQLYGRATSGSIFQPGTLANETFFGWFHADPWLLTLGTLALPVTLLVRRFRPIALAFATFLLFLVRPGYLPATYIIGALPFAALSATCSVQALWSFDYKRLPRTRNGLSGTRRAIPGSHNEDRHPLRWPTVAAKLLAGLLVLGVCTLIVPPWIKGDHTAMTTNTTSDIQNAEVWITQHVPRTSTFIVDDDIWTDLVDDGYRSDNVVWLWELDQDPEVRARFPEAWRDMNYVIGTQALRSSVYSTNAHSNASVFLALAHSTEVARFGSGSNWVSIYRVDPKHTGTPPWWLPGYGTEKRPAHGPDEGE